MGAGMTAAGAGVGSGGGSSMALAPAAGQVSRNAPNLLDVPIGNEMENVATVLLNEDRWLLMIPVAKLSLVRD